MELKCTTAAEMKGTTRTAEDGEMKGIKGESIDDKQHNPTSAKSFREPSGSSSERNFWRMKRNLLSKPTA
jgi:hypothetical protein